MTFLYPLGLLGLIGIPILIIIYIIKSKYTEITVSSTYLWTLSEKFLKKRRPLDKVTGIISLILQILAIALISFALAHPIITLPNSAAEYCFVLDASGSMCINDGQSGTRFETAKDKIESMIDGAVEGSRYSLICVGDSAQVSFERIESKSQAKKLLAEASVTHSEGNYTDAIGVAQSYFDKNNGIKLYLMTDRDYTEHKNVEVVNVSGGSDNYTLKDVTYTYANKNLTVKGNLLSYEGDAVLTVDMYVDGTQTADTSKQFEVKAGVETPFSMTYPAEGGFESVRVSISESDSLDIDNEVCLYNTESEKSYKTLIISDTPFFFESVLGVVMNAKVDVVSTKDYSSENTGYGLYIFDCFEPDQMPRDGAVWFINPTGSVENSGFSVRGSVDVGEDENAALTLSGKTSVLAKELRENVDGSGIYISDYVKCGLYRSFTTVLEYHSHPMLFAGTNTYGNREVVFAFDLHNSNLPLMSDFVVIARNLVKYSFPEVLEEVSYTVGSLASVNVIANCESIRVELPSGEISYLDVSGGITQLKLDEVGTYTLTVAVSGSQRQYKIYAELPLSERDPAADAAESFSIQGESGAGGLDGKFDPLGILLICLVVIIAADWGVYCYEKYQLR